MPANRTSSMGEAARTVAAPYQTASARSLHQNAGSGCQPELRDDLGDEVCVEAGKERNVAWMTTTSVPGTTNGSRTTSNEDRPGAIAGAVLPCSAAEPVDASHLVRSEREAEDVEVLLDPLPVGRL